MKGSKLIKHLQSLVDKHGDVDVMLYQGDGAYDTVNKKVVYYECLGGSKIYPDDHYIVIKCGEDLIFE